MCNNRVEQTVPTRYSAKVITMKCGNTSIYGETLLCDDCIKAGVQTILDPSWRYES